MELKQIFTGGLREESAAKTRKAKEHHYANELSRVCNDDGYIFSFMDDFYPITVVGEDGIETSYGDECLALSDVFRGLIIQKLSGRLGSSLGVEFHADPKDHCISIEVEGITPSGLYPCVMTVNVDHKNCNEIAQEIVRRLNHVDPLPLDCLFTNKDYFSEIMEAQNDKDKQ